MFESFLFSLFLNALIAALSPKPKFPEAKRYGLGEFEVPTATEDRAQSIGWGVHQVAGNVIWFGDYRADKVTERVDTSLFTSTSVTKGYKYHIGMWMTLAGVPCDRVQEIRFGDKVVWSGDLELSKTGVTALDVESRFKQSEGQDIEDGLAGRFLFFNHRVLDDVEYTPLRNHYMEQQLGTADDVPGYPNTLHCVFLGPSGDPGVTANFIVGGILSSAWSQLSGGNPTGFVGSGPSIAPLKFTLSRLPDLTDAFPSSMSVTYPVAGSLNNATVRAALDAHLAAYSSVEGDANPALVELEVLTTRVPGIGPKLYPWAVDTESYLRAAERYHSERHGLSFAWEVSRPINELLADIAEQTNSVRETDERTGKLRTKLVREQDAPLLAFDESNLIELQSFSRSNPELAPNRITVPFIDRSQNWAERVAIAKNPAGIKAAGTVIDYRTEFFGVSREVLAGNLANREARKHGSALARASWVGVVPIGTILKPFDLVTLKHPKLGTTTRMRVLAARFASYSGRLRVELEGIEDIFRSGYGGAVTVPALPGSTATAAPTALTGAQLELAPYALHGDDADHLLYTALDSSTSTDTYRIAYQERMAWSADLAFSYADSEQEPVIEGSLNAALATTATGGNVALTLTSAGVQQWQRQARGLVYLTVGNEWLACSSWSLVGNVLTAQTPTRAIFDTLPGSHAANATVRLLLGFVVLPKRSKTNPGGGLPTVDGYVALVARAESRGLGGALGVASTATSGAAWSYVEGTNRAVKPLPARGVRLAGTYGALASSEVPPALSRASSLSLAWLNRNRLSRTTAGYYDAGTDSEANTQLVYRLEWEGTVAGTWSYGDSETLAPVGATGVTLNTSSVTAGARILRVRMATRRFTSGGNFIDSAPFYAYWRFSS